MYISIVLGLRPTFFTSKYSFLSDVGYVMHPILLIMWTAFQRFILRDNNDNNKSNWKENSENGQGKEISPSIRFKKGLLQGDALCPMPFILCLNPIAWKVWATEGYRLSKPISTTITHLLYIDDMKLFAASENKLKRVMTVAKNAMESTGLKWNEKKCAVIHVKRGQVEQGSEQTDMKIAGLKPIKSLDQQNTYNQGRG